jgi:hypothetical protein
LKLLSKHEDDRFKQPAKLNNPMGLGRLGQTLTAREIFELVKKDLERVEREISLESAVRQLRRHIPGRVPGRHGPGAECLGPPHKL